MAILQNAFHGPVRSHVSILPTYWFYKIVRYFKFDSTYVIAHGLLYFNALVVAAPTDVAIYYIAKWIEVVAAQWQYSHTNHYATNLNDSTCKSGGCSGSGGWIPFLSLIA
eukprot:8717301-Ditylum_brightwellii.AAC.1